MLRRILDGPAGRAIEDVAGADGPRQPTRRPRHVVTTVWNWA